MLPIFNKYIQFLKDNGINENLEEGYYWLNRQIVKAYDIEGNLHKILRVYIDENLNITYKKYRVKKFIIESWEDTIKRNKDNLIQRERESIDLIKNKIKNYNNYVPIILTSTGKDSEVTRYLVSKVVNFPIIVFNNTSLDCADTYKMAKQIPNCQIINPDKGFYQWIKTNIIPTRFSRGCCRVFKEDITIQKLDSNKKLLFFLGMRNEESSYRSNYGDEWDNNKWSNNWKGILPIRKWTEEEVWLYILWNGININTKYKKGYSRVGCAIACPYYTKSSWALDRYWYPAMYRRWHNILEKDFIDNYKWIRVNCTISEYHTCWNGGLKREEPTEEVIKEFAEYKGIDYDIAKKYFNHNCKICNKKVKNKNDIAMNLKLLGRNIEQYYCKKHLMEFLDISKDQYDMYIKEFKKTGCELF